jgi:RNA polymerase sigma-70 factor, ECF subfamily
LDLFLASVEKRAFRMAEIATGNKDEALDILQDAMFKLAEKYADRDEKEWGPLFTTILQSRIKDWYRRNQVRNRFRSWFSNKDDDKSDPIQQAEDEKARTPEQLLQSDRRVDELDLAIHALPLRQQQAFMLRTWEGYSVAETAKAMKCSAGSVKTHYSRAVHTLRDKLDEHW